MALLRARLSAGGGSVAAQTVAATVSTEASPGQKDILLCESVLVLHSPDGIASSDQKSRHRHRDGCLTSRLTWYVLA
ncbi:hypothetical protein VTO73DRAFT_6941 [Trametes versicolor]